MYQFDRAAYEKRMEWYRDARFGMFIHWGLYAIPARGEWVRSVEEIPKENYMKYFYEFSIKEISQITGSSEGEVRTRLCRIRKLLKKDLEGPVRQESAPMSGPLPGKMK